jgi:cytoskeletal protein CcmA (bactofilin family)
MALFTNEADQNVKKEAAGKFTASPQIEPTPVAQAPLPGNSPPAQQSANLVQPTSTKSRSNAEGHAYLDKGTKITGKLRFEGATRIDGQVDGEITVTDSLVIGECAAVTAQIKADSIIVAGKASGDIVATQRLEIRSSGRVTGTLNSPVLIVHEGAIFEGHCSMQVEGAGEDRKLAASSKHEWPPQVVPKQSDLD